MLEKLKTSDYMTTPQLTRWGIRDKTYSVS
nr:MAG TPA: hypothetical protein [Caudoviricetes sp.]